MTSWINLRAKESPDGGGNEGPPLARPIRILHVINDLAIGGAEVMLFKLLSYTNRAKFEPTVISLNGMDQLGERIQDLGINVYSLGIKPPAPRAWPLIGLARRARSLKPDLVQGWMFHGNLA